MPKKRRPAIDRLLDRVMFEPMSGCWITTYCLDRDGYGLMGEVPGKTVKCHRLAYQHFVGPIPDGLVIDHLCRNRACCNPDHLEAVTNRENVMRSPITPNIQLSKSGKCKRGHDLSFLESRGRNMCKRCHADKQLIYNRQRRKAA